MKYQDIELHLKRASAHPSLRLVIQSLHAENMQLKDENKEISIAMDKIVSALMHMQEMIGVHQGIFKGLEAGKSMSDIITSLRAEHLDNNASVQSEQT